jgi:hypothetical protein
MPARIQGRMSMPTNASSFKSLQKRRRSRDLLIAWCGTLLIINLLWFAITVDDYIRGLTALWTVPWQAVYTLWLLAVLCDLLRGHCSWRLSLSFCALILAEGILWLLGYGVPSSCCIEIPLDQVYLGTLPFKAVSLVLLLSESRIEFCRTKGDPDPWGFFSKDLFK